MLNYNFCPYVSLRHKNAFLKSLVKNGEDKRFLESVKKFNKVFKQWISEKQLYQYKTKKHVLNFAYLIEWRYLWDLLDIKIEKNFCNQNKLKAPLTFTSFYLWKSNKIYSAIWNKFAKKLYEYKVKKFFSGFNIEFRQKKQKKIKIFSSDLLVVGINNRSVERFYKVLPCLLKSKLTVHLLMSKKITVKPLKVSGFSSSYFSEWLNQKIKYQESINWPPINSKIQQIKNHENYLSVCKFFLNATYPYLKNFVQAAENVMQNIKPRLVLNFEDAELNRIFNWFAMLKKIPSVAIFFCSGDTRVSLFKRSCEYLFVPGRNLKKMYKQAFRKKIIVVGDPSIKPQKKSLGTLNSILFVGSYPAFNITKNIIEEALKITIDIAQQNNYRIAIKAHPLQNPSFFKKMIKQTNLANVEIYHQEDLIMLSKKYDVFSVLATSAVFLLLQQNKPIISCLPQKTIKEFKMFGFDYSVQNGIIPLNGHQTNYLTKYNFYINNKKTLTKILLNQKKFSKKFISFFGQTSAKKINQNLLSIINNSEK